MAFTVVAIVPAFKIDPFLSLKFAMKIIIDTDIFPRSKPLNGTLTALNTPPRNPSENAQSEVRFFVMSEEFVSELFDCFIIQNKSLSVFNQIK